MLLTSKLNHPCPACGADRGKPCVRGKKRKPVAVFCGPRPADFGEVLVTGKRSPIAVAA